MLLFPETESSSVVRLFLATTVKFYPKSLYIYIYKSNSGSRSRRLKHKTESISFRIESIILNKLRQEARQKEVSLNTLFTQIARQHITWHTSASTAGFISVRRALIQKLLERYSDDEIRSISRFVADVTSKDFILLLTDEHSIESALEFIENWVRVSGYPYKHNISSIDHFYIEHSFIIQHDMGIKWSIYISELYRGILKEFDVGDLSFDITDNTLSFRLRLPQGIDKNSSKFNNVLA